MRTLVAVIIALVFVPFWSAASIAQQMENDNARGANATQVPVVADILITGGPIYTADDNNPQATAVAVKDGRFIYVGSTDGAQAFIGTNTRIITLDGAAMFPGFVDAHAHLAGIGQRELSFNLENTASLDALKKSIISWRNVHPEDTVIIGRGWIETHWPEKRTPTRWDLDQIITDIPVMLIRADGHAWLSTARQWNLQALIPTPTLLLVGISSEMPWARTRVC